MPSLKSESPHSKASSSQSKLDNLLSRQSATGACVANFEVMRARTTSPYHRIYLIDDDAINNLLNRQFLTFVLPQANILTFQDARIVVRYLDEGKMPVPDLILLDVNMPELDGWEVLYHLQQRKIKCDVIMLSSSMHFDDIERSKQYENVKCYIRKPLTEEKIVRYLVEQKFDEVEVD